jgi:hypothetical protein
VSRDNVAFGRSAGELISGQLTSHMTTVTTTPALVAQALSGKATEIWAFL